MALTGFVGSSPGIFRRLALMILAKTHSLPYVEFSAELACENERKIHPEIDYTALCSQTGADFWQWLAYSRKCSKWLS
jgi:Ni2+-binding GTPase involved in maturation of urease and hydrogenase